MLIKNIASGGRGLGVAGHDPIHWAPGETKDVDAAIIAKAKQDPANAALLGSDLVVVDGPAKSARVSVNDAEIEAAAAQARADAERREVEAKAKSEADAKAQADAEAAAHADGKAAAKNDQAKGNAKK